MKGRILVARGGAIGDFILTLPVLAALRSQYPDAHLEILGYPHIVSLARTGNLVHGVRSIEAGPLAGFFVRGGILEPDLLDYFRSFQVVVSYLYDPDGIFQENVRRCQVGVPSQFIQAEHRPNDGGSVHATEVFLKALERLAIYDADPVPRLLLGETPPVFTKPRVLACHPGSGSERKNWPESRWELLLDLMVRETDWSILLVGGEAEGQRLERLARRVPSGRIEVARSLPLPQLAERLRHCSAFIGHDSGISHLCAALGLPGLVLWADTNPAVWRPRSDRIRILRHPKGILGLESATVFAECHGLL